MGTSRAERRRRIHAFAASSVPAATGVVTNFATEWKNNPAAWFAVLVLTAGSGLLALVVGGPATPAPGPVVVRRGSHVVRRRPQEASHRRVRASRPAGPRGSHGPGQVQARTDSTSTSSSDTGTWPNCSTTTRPSRRRHVPRTWPSTTTCGPTGRTRDACRGSSSRARSA